jgi:hypothetical protein
MQYVDRGNFAVGNHRHETANRNIISSTKYKSGFMGKPRLFSSAGGGGVLFERPWQCVGQCSAKDRDVAHAIGRNLERHSP